MAEYYEKETIIDEILAKENRIIDYDEIKENEVTKFPDGIGYLVKCNWRNSWRESYKRTIKSKQSIIKSIRRNVPCLNEFNFRKNKMIIAGGFITDVVCFDYGEDYNPNDIDIFSFETNEADFQAHILNLLEHVFGSAYYKKCRILMEIGYWKEDEKVLNKIIKLKNYVENCECLSEINLYETFRSYNIIGDNHTKIQIIRHGFKNLNDLFDMFDINCSQFAYDGINIYTTTLGKYALLNRAHILRTDRVSDSFKYRINKYWNKGFDLVINHVVGDSIANIGIIQEYHYGIIQDNHVLSEDSDTYDMNIKMLYNYEENNVRALATMQPDYIVGYVHIDDTLDYDIFENFKYMDEKYLKIIDITSCSNKFLKYMLSRKDFLEYMEEFYKNKINFDKWNKKIFKTYDKIKNILGHFKQRQIDLNDKSIFGVKTNIDYKQWLFGK